jgi:hypothetical protein
LPDPIAKTVAGLVDAKVVLPDSPDGEKIVAGKLEATVHLADLAGTPPLPATTTHQEDLTTAGQRRVNLIWEYTQAAIALMIVGACVVVASLLAIKGRTSEFPVILTSLVMLVIGFYFSRTNHAAIGGVGHKPNDEYRGR